MSKPNSQKVQDMIYLAENMHFITGNPVQSARIAHKFKMFARQNPKVLERFSGSFIGIPWFRLVMQYHGFKAKDIKVFSLMMEEMPDLKLSTLRDYAVYYQWLGWHDGKFGNISRGVFYRLSQYIFDGEGYTPDEHTYLEYVNGEVEKLKNVYNRMVSKSS